MLRLAKVAENYDWKYGSLSAFLRSKVTAPGREHHIPRFYGIPKIHKEPVKFRPILPCHSAIQNPAAKFVSKMLKPLIAEAQTVIIGSKDLAIKLSQLRLIPGRKYYIVTGDVVAYYPSIPLGKCLERVFDMFSEWLLNNESDAWWLREYGEKFTQFFKDCLQVGNTQLLTQFNGVTYEQLNGLAMGVADSPDLANLYGWYCEKRDAVLQNSDIAYYGRYIDDCIGIVYAESPQEALATMQSAFTIDDCALTWEVGRFLPFLDMMLIIDGNNKLQHMPYRKAQSLHQRIPWISAHPLDVKRGTFYGEMSRLATLSSTLEYYDGAVKWLVALYVGRGYPKPLVERWLKDKYAERWNNRVSIPEEEEGGVLVLKSEFNTAWGLFNAHELGNTIQAYMRNWLNRAERMDFNLEFPPEMKDWTDDVTAGVSVKTVNAAGTEVWTPDIRATDLLDRDMIVSRKRTFNLSDLTGLWKKIVLEQQGVPIAREDAIRPLLGSHQDALSLALAGEAIFSHHRSGRLIGQDDEEINVHQKSPSPEWEGNPDDMAATYSRVGLR